MTDFHTHILPNLDDGASSPEESLALLRLLIAQGVSQAALTPHFYGNQRSPEEFLELRAAAMEQLPLSDLPGCPELRPGAEVYYYSGISAMEQLPRLCLQGTDLLLLEMPFSAWTPYMLSEVEELCSDFDVLLAHVDRYFSFEKQGVWEQLLEAGARFQVNADAFLHFSTRGKAFRMLEQGQLLALGSDCHNTTRRPPNIGEAMARIEKRYGKREASRYFRFSFDDE